MAGYPGIIPGYWQADYHKYWPDGYFDPDYWPHWFERVEPDGGRFGRWQPVRMPWIYRDDDDEVLLEL